MRWTRSRWRTIGVLNAGALLLVLASAVAADAQTVSGSLVGTVTERSAAVLPGATVVITDAERGTTRESVTNAEGPDSRTVEESALDYALRDWRTARDSAARRIGLVEEDLPRTVDPAKLPDRIR